MSQCCGKDSRLNSFLDFATVFFITRAVRFFGLWDGVHGNVFRDGLQEVKTTCKELIVDSMVNLPDNTTMQQT